MQKNHLANKSATLKARLSRRRTVPLSNNSATKNKKETSEESKDFEEEENGGDTKESKSNKRGALALQSMPLKRRRWPIHSTVRI